ncbi:MAG: (d)CMP kinase [Actinomycetota bacterium]
MDSRRLLIAIDGPAGAGKSTVAQALARRLGLSYLDTGAMYRAFALKVLESGVDPSDEKGVEGLLGSTRIDAGTDTVLVDGRDVSGLVRGGDVSAVSSVVAAIPAVRRRLVELQKEVIARDPAGAVVEGRDIGTVVMPLADLKIFITAADSERARRRALQTGLDPRQELDAIRARDRRDSERGASPLKAADDAVIIDTTGLTAGEVVEKILAMLP